MRHAYVDRNSCLGGPDFLKNPLDRLLDKNYTAGIRAVIDERGIPHRLRPRHREAAPR